MEFTMDIGSFEKGIAKKKIEIRDGMNIAINSLANFCVQKAQEHLTVNHSVITGKLRQSIQYKVENEGESVKAYVGPNAVTAEGMQYGKFVEFGRGPVFASAGKTLHFQIDGKDIFVKSVKAAPAKPFLAPALHDTEANATAIIKLALKL